MNRRWQLPTALASLRREGFIGQELSLSLVPIAQNGGEGLRFQGRCLTGVV